MTLKKFKQIDEVVNHFEISFQKVNFLDNIAFASVPTFLKAEIEYVLQNIPYKVSEAAIRENILYPILKEIFKKHDDTLMLWANKSIAYNKELSGMPDYIIAKQSERGKIIFGKPILAVVEAKNDGFEGGWAQCLLEMVIIQKINNNNNVTVYGIVTNGDNWEFGQLENKLFSMNLEFCTVLQLERLYAVLSHFFYLCRENALKL